MKCFAKENAGWSRIAIVVSIVLLCLLIVKMIFVDSQPVMRFIIPIGFRGAIRISRSKNGILPTLTGHVTTFVIPSSGKLEIVGELPYERLSLTQVMWIDGEEIQYGVGEAKPEVDKVYFWAAVSNRSAIWCFVGTQTEYYEWLSHGSP